MARTTSVLALGGVDYNVYDAETRSAITSNSNGVLAITKDYGIESGGWSGAATSADSRRIRYKEIPTVTVGALFDFYNSDLYYSVNICDDNDTQLITSGWIQGVWYSPYAGKAHIGFATGASWGESANISVSDFGNSVMVVSSVLGPIKSKADKTYNGLYGEPTVYVLPSTSSTSRQFKYEFKAGCQYTIQNNTTASITFQTRETQSGSTIDGTDTIQSGKSASFVATTDAHWFNSWSPNAGNIAIYEMPKQIINYGERKVNIQDALAVITFPGTAWAELNTTANTLTFPADTSILANDESNRRFNLANGATVSFAGIDTSFTKVVFSKTTQTFSLVRWNYKIPDDCLLIAAYKTEGEKNLTISCRYKIDGKPYGIDAVQASGVFNAEPYSGSYDWSTPVTAYGKLFKGKSAVEAFAFISDPHVLGFGDSDRNETRMHNYLKRVQTAFNQSPCSYIVAGGDWLNNSTTMDEACFRLGQLKGIADHMFDGMKLVLGNHDTNYQGKETSTSDNYTGRLTDETIAAIMYRDTNTKKAYYSFDGDNAKCYVLDSGIEHNTMLEYDWEQVAWLAGKLAEDNPEHAIIFLHIIINSDAVQTNATNFGSLVQAYNGHTSVTLNGQTYNFANCTGHVDFWVAGHTHTDETGTLGGIPYFTTATNSYNSDVPLIDFVLVDYDGGKIYTVRAGGTGQDRVITM